MGHSKGSPEREVNSDTGLPKKKKEIFQTNNLHLQEMKEQQQRQPRVEGKK